MMLPTFVKMVKNAPHPFQFVQFSLRVRNSRPRPDMVQGIADQLHSSERDTKRGDKACSAIPVGETADVVHIGIDLVGLMRQHERCPTLLCPRFSAIPPSFLVVSVGVNNERNASRNSLVQMVSSIEVGHDTEDIHSVKAGANRSISGDKYGVCWPGLRQVILLYSRPDQHHLFRLHESLSEVFQCAPPMVNRPSQNRSGRVLIAPFSQTDGAVEVA